MRNVLSTAKGRRLDLELFLNRICSIFKHMEAETPEDESRHAALSASSLKERVQGYTKEGLAARSQFKIQGPGGVQNLSLIRSSLNSF